MHTNLLTDDRFFAEIKKCHKLNKFLGKNEFNKYSQKLDIQLKDYNDKINDILLKISFK